MHMGSFTHVLEFRLFNILLKTLAKPEQATVTARLRTDPLRRRKLFSCHSHTCRPAWARQLSNGWHALRLKDTGARCVILVVRCAGTLVVFAQASVGARSEGIRRQ